MELKSRIKKFNQDIEKYAPIGLLTAYFDLFVSAILFGASFDDYIRYRFWEKSLRERDQFITYLRSKRLIKKYNSKAAAEIFSNKALFNQKFEKYLNREWLNLQDASEQEFQLFIEKHPNIICKPIDGAGGHGIEIFQSSKIIVPDFLNLHRNYVAEEVIRQHELMERLNPTSVNTIRAISFCCDGKASIIAAIVRVGRKGSVVDNTSSGGTCASIDLDSGIVFTKELDRNFCHLLFHPETDICLIGMRIPNWEIVKQTIIECAELIPGARYIGWDIAITPDGCCVIEGNHDPAHDGYQASEQIGKYRLIVGK